MSICDGAHVPGMFAANFHDLGVDFLAGAGHKWQCGPLGTGILYVRNKVLPQYNPRPLPAYYPVVTSSYPLTGELPPRTTNEKETDDIAARIQSTGSRNAPVYMGLAKSCETWDRIGREDPGLYHRYVATPEGEDRREVGCGLSLLAERRSSTGLRPDSIQPVPESRAREGQGAFGRLRQKDAG